MVDQTVLGGVALGLEGTEEGLLSTENLQGGGGVFGQVGERTSVGDEAGSNGRANEGLQVGSDLVHLGLQVAAGGLAVVGLLDNGRGELLDDVEIGGENVKAHGDLGGVNDGLGLFAVFLEICGKVVALIVGQSLLVANGDDELGIRQVVRDNLDQLGKVPAVPFADTHEELVHALVLEVERGTGLDDVVVVLGDAELDLGTRVGVTHTETGLFDIASLEVAQELVGVQADAANNVRDNLRGIGGLALQTREFALDGTSQVLLGDTEGDLALLAALGEVELEDRLEVLGADTLGDEVDVLEGFDMTAVREFVLVKITCRVKIRQI